VKNIVYSFREFEKALSAYGFSSGNINSQTVGLYVICGNLSDFLMKNHGVDTRFIPPEEVTELAVDFLKKMSDAGYIKPSTKADGVFDLTEKGKAHAKSSYMGSDYYNMYNDL